MDGQRIGPVSLARCAELLTAAGDKIDRSALSRYTDRHSLKLPRQGKEQLVDFETVQAHRSENYTREVQSGTPVPVVAAAAQPAPAPGGSMTQQVLQLSEHRELKAIQVRRELREEAKEEGLLTEVAEVEAGAADAIVALRTAFAADRGALAETIVARFGLKPEDVRPMRDILRRYDRKGQEAFAGAMAKLLVEGYEETGDTLERLQLLAAVSIRMRARRSRAFAKRAGEG